MAQDKIPPPEQNKNPEAVERQKVQNLAQEEREEVAAELDQKEILEANGVPAELQSALLAVYSDLNAKLVAAGRPKMPLSGPLIQKLLPTAEKKWREGQEVQGAERSDPRSVTSAVRPRSPGTTDPPI